MIDSIGGDILTQALYHKTQLLYARNDLIQAGNFGRLVSGWGFSGNPRTFCQEYVLERIRQLEFPDKPSRMKSTFVFDNFELIHDRTRDPFAKNEYIYLVRLEAPYSKYHRGDITWIDILFDECRTFKGIDNFARNYWKGIERAPNKWEIIVACDLIIEDRLTKIPENGTSSC